MDRVALREFPAMRRAVVATQAPPAERLAGIILPQTGKAGA